MQLSDEEWKKKLTPEQYHVLREKGTEYPGTGKLLYNDKDGMYICAACGTKLFSSDSKYESTMPGLIGWPSFAEAANNEALELVQDSTLGMSRTEVNCANCGGHLGHLFEDPSSPNGQHFCINSASLDFEEKK
jgi:peptide-methionine (R)-S-oxide reductase